MIILRIAAAALALATLGVADAVKAQAPLGEDPLASRYFTIEWSSAADRAPATTKISGYVNNRYGLTMAEIRLVVEMLDDSQAVVARRYEWLGRNVGPFSRSYFEVRKLPPAAGYRVAVHSYTIVESQPFL